MIVIPMAGLSRRFTEAGYQSPKFMLDLHGQTLFAHSVRSFEGCFQDEPFLFITRDEPGFEDFIRQQARAIGVKDFAVALLPKPTAGQAETVELGLRAQDVALETPITIFNIDTFRPGFRYPQKTWMNTTKGYLEVMAGQSDPGYSYVRPAPGWTDERVVETAEKIVISDLASTGLYWFRHAGDFLDAFSDKSASLAHGELYVAPIYNKLIQAGWPVHYEIVKERDVVFCGTPAQYHALLDRRGAASP